MEQELIEQEEQIEGTITIGSGELTAVQILPELITSFRKKYPLVTYDILTANADVIKEQMEKGLIDVGILLEPVDMERFDFIRLTQKERWAAVMRSDDPMAKKKFVTAKDLSGRSLILPRRQNVKNELAHWFGDAFEESNVLFTSNLSTNAAIMVQGGLGYAVVIEGSLPFWAQNQITYRPLSPELTASCALAWKKKQPFSLAATKFIQHIKFQIKNCRFTDLNS